MIKTWTPEERVQNVEAVIDRLKAGEIVGIVDASWCANEVCIGDFRDYGMSERIATRTSLYYLWRGPGTIKIGEQILPPMTYTEETEMDWT